jgi:AraC family transcriptional regulator, chitin signaling transcriptional activator
MHMYLDTADKQEKSAEGQEGHRDPEYLRKLLLLASLEISKKNKVLSEINKLIRSDRRELDVAKVSTIIQNELGNQDNITSIELMRHSNDFFERLEKHFPSLGELDKQLCAYCLANLSSKDIAVIRGVEPKTIEMARYRLRRKLSIPRDTSIHRFLQNIR